jgi:hypothetical protein
MWLSLRKFMATREKRRQFLRNIQVLDFIISTGTCIYNTLEGFQRRGTQKHTTL